MTLIVLSALWMTGFNGAAALAGVSQFGGHGSADGLFSGPASGAAVGPDGSVYVVDRGANRVQRFTNAGSFLGKVGAAGSATSPVQFSSPWDASTDAAGNLFVGDTGNGRIVELTKDLAFVQTFGAYANASELLVAAGPAGVYTVDQQLGGVPRIQRWSNAATPAIQAQRTIPAGELSLGILPDIATDGTGNLYVTDGARHDVAVFNPALALVRRIGAVDGSPQGIAIGTAGGQEQLYLGVGPAIKRFSLLGAALGSFSGSCPSSFCYPAGLAVDASGNLFDSEFDQRVLRIDTTPDPAFGASPAVPQTSQTVTFDASASHVDLWGVSSYEWDLDGDGIYDASSGTGPTATRRVDEAGAAAVGLRISGTNGRVAETRLNFTVTHSHASIEATPALALTGQLVTLNAESSALPASSISRVDWDLDNDGAYETSTGTGLSLQHPFDRTGKTQVGVRVTRSGGVVDTASAPVEIRLSPPPGRIGVSINAGAKYTNNPAVAISVIWPPFASTATIANDGGFRNTGSLALAPTLTWSLLNTGLERLPKTIYVRFDANDQNTYQDDIILDQTAPTVQAATLAAPKKGRAALRLKAKDNASGVSRVQIRRAKAKIFTAKFKRLIRLTRISGKVSVRVQDGAGNFSAWRRTVRPHRHRG